MKSILEYLEHSAMLFPGKTALSSNDETVTFEELVSKSRKLASVTAKYNCGQGIPVFVNRGIQSVIMFFAAVYSGSFYIPVDPDMPIEKIQYVINEVSPSVILGEDRNRELIAKLDFDGFFLTPDDAYMHECETPVIDGDTLLYMVYTSGSTGKPKGVLKSHGNVVSFIEAYCSVFGFSSDEIIGNQTPLFFDASAKDIYLMLKTGATLDIIPTEKFAMPPELIDYMNRKRITFISWVPTALSIIAKLRTFSFIKPEFLKRVFFVGEVMPMKTLNYWRKHLPDVVYVNLYGQSEIAGIDCYYIVEGEFGNDENLPMGKPLDNCKIYLLDGDAVIEEPEHIGEIYVVSDAVATGYYSDEEKTRASFVFKDFGDGPVRAFKTGDLAYFDRNGLLIFASRSDFQIKHSGHRIELGEIETAAGALHETERCCCLYNSEKQQIVLFVETAQDVMITPAEIKSLLKQKLSSYMVPEKILLLDRLPINANGKIDRQKLKELV